MDEKSTTTMPGRRPSAAPPDPNITSATVSASVTHSISTSHPFATSAGLDAATAPAVTSGASFAAERFQMVTA